MIGPTGVGKTEIARRLARLAQSPFIKVEASKFTEVGYVGRDVESMVRDLVELAVDMVREERLDEVHGKAEQNAEERLLDLLLPPPRATLEPDDPTMPPCNVEFMPERRRRRTRGSRRAKSSASSCATAGSTIARSSSTCASARFRRSRSSPDRRSRRSTSTSRTCCPG